MSLKICDFVRRIDPDRNVGARPERSRGAGVIKKTFEYHTNYFLALTNDLDSPLISLGPVPTVASGGGRFQSL